MDLMEWSWIFLGLYIALMVGIGLYAQRKIKHADDFATARGAYGPFFLALAFAASTASGATFLGSPALSYEWGLAANWGNFLYPIGVYVGILISMRLIATSGNRFGNRSIPEYLGDRYQSEFMRLAVSLLSLVLFFYLAGQLVSGVVMFEIMLGLNAEWALGITTLVLLFYVVLGGAHALVAHVRVAVLERKDSAVLFQEGVEPLFVWHLAAASDERQFQEIKDNVGQGRALSCVSGCEPPCDFL